MIEEKDEVLHLASGDICRVLKVIPKGYRILDLEDSEVFDVKDDEIKKILQSD